MSIIAKIGRFFGFGEKENKEIPVTKKRNREFSNEELDDPPIKRKRESFPDPDVVEFSNNTEDIPVAEEVKSPLQKFFSFFKFMSPPNPATKNDLNTAPIRETDTVQFQALAPTKLGSQGAEEVKLVKVVNQGASSSSNLFPATPQHPSDDSVFDASTAHDALANFSGFVPKAISDRPSLFKTNTTTGIHIRTEHERARHSLLNSPANVKRGIKSGYKSTYDKVFGSNSFLTRPMKSQKKTAFEHSVRLEERSKYKSILDTFFKINPGRSPSTLVKSPYSLSRDRTTFPKPSRQLTSTAVKKTATDYADPIIVQKSPPPPQSDGSPVLPVPSPSKEVKLIEEIKSVEKQERKNKLEEELSRNDVYNEDFLKQLKEKYDVTARNRQKEIEKAQAKKELYEAKNRKESDDIVNERLLNYLRISTGREDVTLEDEIEDDEDIELAEITEEMLVVIRGAERSRSGTLVDAHKIQITGNDIETLKGLNWLNDEVINFYMQMIVQRSSEGNKKFPLVYAFSTFFYPKLMDSGHSGVKRWTKKVDLFSHSLILIPVHLGMHWCLAVIDLEKKAISYYDSMGGRNNRCLRALSKYIEEEHLAKKSAPLDMSDWSQEIAESIPQQMNGSDCGMFTCKFAEYISRRKKITFTQKDMPHFRRRMIWEIVENTILHP